jgi:hypothetical protein
MPRPNVVVCIVTVLAGVVGAGAAWAQTYPIKPIRFLTTGVGAGTDLAARTVALGLLENAGWNVIVDDRGSTIVSAEVASRAPPDGYNLLVLTDGLWRGSWHFLSPSMPPPTAFARPRRSLRFRDRLAALAGELGIDVVGDPFLVPLLDRQDGIPQKTGQPSGQSADKRFVSI